MKSLFLALLSISILIISCKKDKDAPVDPPAPPPVTDIIKKENDRLAKVVTSETTDTYLSGIVLDEEGKPLSGVSVNCGTATVTTNNKGIFQFPSKLSVNKNYAIVTASINGYFKAIKTFTPNPSGKAHHYNEIKLLKANAEKTVTATGGIVILDNKINLTFPDGAVVTSTGASYTGQYKVSARYIDPSSDNFLETMPGLLAGLNDQDQIQALQSFGMANVELKDMSGNPLQIAPGKTVKMVLPATANAPATIPLWHFNEKYGLWIKAGIATKSGDSYAAEVNHFSIWNLDLESNGFTLNLEFKNSQANPLSGLKVLASTQSGFKIATFYTDNEGKASLVRCPATESLILKGIFDCDTIEKLIQPVTANRNEIITIQNNSALLKEYTITGILTDCNNVRLQNQPFLLSIQNSGKLMAGSTDNQGHFLINTTFCNASNSITIQANIFDGNAYYYAPAITTSLLNVTYDTRICDSTTGVPDNFLVVFPDPMLEKSVRQAINKAAGDILYGDVKNIDSLTDPGNAGLQGLLQSLEGIQFCTNLSVISFHTQNLTNLSPLQNLKKLKSIFFGASPLDNEYISDLSPLQNSYLLEELHLIQTKVTDVSVLKNLQSLKILSIDVGLVKDISSIKDFPSIEKLTLSNCEIQSIMALKDLLRIKSLNIAYNKISDISILPSLVNLRELSIEGNQISNFSPLQVMVDITSLSMSTDSLTTTDILSPLINLESLSLNNGQLSNISALAGLKKLKTLAFGATKVSDITALANLDKLESINMNFCNVSDLTPLRNLNNLSTIFGDYNNITNLTPLVNGVPSLFVLSLQNQRTGKISQAQKDAFTASHPNTVVFWD